MFEAVYIADSNNSLVFEYLVTLSSPSFKSLISTIQLKQNDSDSTTLTTFAHGDKSSVIEINSELFVCSQKTSSLIIYVLCHHDEDVHPNPVIPFVFIGRLIEAMEDYFGSPLALTKIEAHADTLMLLMSEMIDDGIPNVTDFNQLRDIVPFKSLLSKILSTSNDLASAAAKKSLGSLTTTTGSSSNFSSTPDDFIPWRRSNVKYTNNEMYVDVVETLSVILKPSSSKNIKNVELSSKKYDSAFYSTSLRGSLSKLVPVGGNILGEINLLSHLTGVPYLQMILNIGGLHIEPPSFHPCINLDKWLGHPGNLSFIPPDGRSTLMNYQVNFDEFSSKQVKDQFLGLIDVDYQFGLGPSKKEFEVRLTIKTQKSVSKIEDLRVDINVFESDERNALDADAESKSSGRIEGSNADINAVSNIKTSRITHGDFQYKGNGRGEWNLRSTVTGIQPILRGAIVTSEEPSESSQATAENLIDIDTSMKRASKAATSTFLQLSYTHKGSVPSGLKVDSLKILSAKGLGDTVKPYKGVKYITKTGDFVVRS